MEIKRSGSQPSGKGPAEWFTGTVRIDPLFPATAPRRAAGNAVTFEPGARTAWHTHPLGQTLIVTFGCGLMTSSFSGVDTYSAKEPRFDRSALSRPVPKTLSPGLNRLTLRSEIAIYNGFQAAVLERVNAANVVFSYPERDYY